MAIEIDGNSLTLENFQKIIIDGEKVSLSNKAKERVQRSRQWIEKALKEDRKIYSINTGFGILSDVRIDNDKVDALQENIIKSHCCSVGNPHTELESRSILLLRLNTLAKGFSGARVELLDTLIQMLNKRVHPIIPRKGSVGASGDLSPLAHLAAVVIGDGEAYFEGKRLPGSEAMKAAGIRPIELKAKEGLALVNGTQQMTGVGAFTLIDARKLVDLADLAAASSLEGILGSASPFTEWVQKTRPFEGQKHSAALLRNFLEGSEIGPSHADCERVQDPYSLRCTPQIHGSVRDLIAHTQKTLEIEFNAATDNPLVHPETGEIVSQGNFHGQPIAFALDILGMALNELASISERRLVKLLDPQWSGLPSFLIVEEGLNSGFMVTQYTAAALVSENRGLTHPSSTDTVPTCNEKEDHVSMGPRAGRKAQKILWNTQTVLAIEFLAAAQALDFRKPLKPGKGPQAVYDFVRKRVKPLDRDRYLHKDIEVMVQALRSGDMFQALKDQGIL